MNEAPRGNRLWQSVQAEVRKHKWSAVSTPTRWTRKTELKFSSQAQMFFKGICFFDFFVLFDDLILCIDGLSSSPVWYLWKQSTRIKSEFCFAFVNFRLFHDKEGFPSQNLKSNTSTDIISHVVKILFPGGRREKWEFFYQLNKYRQILFGSGIFLKKRRWAFYSEFSYFFGKPCCLYSFVLYYQQDNVCPTPSLSLIGEPSILDFGKKWDSVPTIHANESNWSSVKQFE